MYFFQKDDIEMHWLTFYTFILYKINDYFFLYFLRS